MVNSRSIFSSSPPKGSEILESQDGLGQIFGTYIDRRLFGKVETTGDCKYPNLFDSFILPVLLFTSHSEMSFTLPNLLTPEIVGRTETNGILLTKFQRLPRTLSRSRLLWTDPLGKSKRDHLKELGRM